MKRSTKIYFRTLYLSLVIMFCLSFGFIGVCTAYENTVRVVFGKETAAVRYIDGKLHILDFVIEIK